MAWLLASQRCPAGSLPEPRPPSADRGPFGTVTLVPRRAAGRSGSPRPVRPGLGIERRHSVAGSARARRARAVEAGPGGKPNPAGAAGEPLSCRPPSGARNATKAAAATGSRPGPSSLAPVVPFRRLATESRPGLAANRTERSKKPMILLRHQIQLAPAGGGHRPTPTGLCHRHRRWPSPHPAHPALQPCSFRVSLSS